MKKFWFNTLAMTLAVTMTVCAVTPASAGFSDVVPANSHHTAIEALQKQGIIQGFEDGTYRPGVIVTRGQAVKTLVKLMDLDTSNVENPNFSDVPVGHAYYKEIAALENAQIINGFTDGSFRSGRGVTREQMARMLAKAFALSYQNTPLPFSDVIVDSEAHPYIGALYEHKITIGKDGMFDLYSPVTRGQFATFIYRAQQVMEKRVVKRLRPSDFNVTFLDGYVFGPDDPVAIMHRSGDDLVVEGLREGKSTLAISAYRETDEYIEYVFSQNYEITVTETNGKLEMTIEEDESISPASIIFDVMDIGFIPSDVTIESISGEKLDESLYEFTYYEESELFELTMYDVGQYIVTFKNEAGVTKRAGLVSEFGEVELNMYHAYEQSEAAISFRDLGFKPAKVEYEQFTGALFNEHVVNWEIGASSFNIFHAAVGDAMFAFKLFGDNGEVVFIQGVSYQVAGLTAIEYVIVSEEEMETGIF